MIFVFLLNLRRSQPPIQKPFLNQLVSFLHTSLPFKQQHNWHTSTTRTSLLSLLETKCKSLNHLKQIQAQMILSGLILDWFASSRLVAFCASQSGNLHYCTEILNHVPNANIFSFNITIRAYSDSPLAQQSLVLYKKLLQSGTLRPDHYTFPFLLKACAQLSMVQMGFVILSHVWKLGFDSDIFVHNGVIHMLVLCGEVEAARHLFDESCVRDLVSWNSIINGYVRSGHPREALKLFHDMEKENIEADEVTMMAVVSACTQLEDLRLGSEFHQYIKEHGLKLTIPLTNALMDMYVKCGSLQQAKMLFSKMNNRTMISWTTMIVGYAKFGLLEEARKLFDEMPERDVVSWNALISGYMQCKRGKDALALFHEMQAMNVKPDQVTMASLLSVCSQLGALDIGEWIHHYVEKHKVPINVALGTALVDMYAKCGNISKALQVFRDIPRRNGLTWTAMISGLALHGHPRDAITYFFEMISIGLVPDEVTFLGVLSACCHTGLVDEGRKIFTEMSLRFNISPTIKHYSCMVDLLGRAGLLEEAEQLIKSMPMEPDVVMLGALFFACKIHTNIALGELVASKLLELDPQDSGNYVLLEGMYLEANMTDKAVMVRRMMKERKIEKAPGCSSIQVNGDVSEFIVRDKSHPQSPEIYGCLITLTKQSQLDGYTVTVTEMRLQFMFFFFFFQKCKSSLYNHHHHHHRNKQKPPPPPTPL